MNQIKPRKTRRNAWLALLALPVIAGCSSTQHAALSSSGPAPAVPVNLRFDALPDGATPGAYEARFRKAFRQALLDRGLRIAEGAPYSLHVAFAERPDTIGIAQEGAVGSAPVWFSQVVPRRGILTCKRQRLRATVLGETGQVSDPVLLGAGELSVCMGEQAPVEALAGALAERLAVSGSSGSSTL